MEESFTIDLTNINNRILSGAIELSRGQSFSITGSGFGSAPTYWDFLDKSPIMTDSATYPIGSNFGRVGRWSGLDFIGASNRPVIKAEGVDGGRALYWFRPKYPGRPNNCLMYYYDNPVPLGTVIYFTRWVKHRIYNNEASTGGQWKDYRLMASVSSLTDKPNESYKNIYVTPGVNNITDNKIQVRDDSYVQNVGPEKTLHSGTSIRTPILKNAHIRIDTRVTLPSSYANKQEYYHEEWIWSEDGSVTPYYYLYTDDQAVDQASPYSSDASRWNLHLYQNYLGTGASGDFTDQDHEMWYSKVAEVVGGDCRLEFGSTPNHVRSPISFMNPYDSWADTTIGATFDPGTLNFGYMKVIRGETILKVVPVRVV